MLKSNHNQNAVNKILFKDRKSMKYTKECVENLNEPLREAFTLKMLEDQTTEEICKEMNISSNYLWVLLHRAREQLKLSLTEKWLNRDSN